MARRTSASLAPAAAPSPASAPPARPFLKWAGGKTQLLAQLAPRVPAFRRYFEPFLGGGAMFFRLRPEEAVLADANAELVACYASVRDAPEAVIQGLEGHRYERDHYYRVRAEDPHELPPPARAARTIFLNKAGFNGLFRVNRAGQFNVPFGRYKTPPNFGVDNIRACAEALRHAELTHADFADVLARAEAGDFVYLDPPYAPVSDTADFTSYVSGGFDQEDQERLAEAFAALTARGVFAMMSNSNVRAITRLYPSKRYRLERVEAARSINSDPSGRGKIRELLVMNYPPP